MRPCNWLTQLDRYRGRNPLILAIPRGAVPMGEVLAEQLDGELDVVLVRKLRAPFNPEFAIGAVSESGWKDIADYAAESGADEDYLRREIATPDGHPERAPTQLRGIAGPIDPSGRIVIVVDDGLATGYTMVAALQSVRAAHPARVVCAVPVASHDALVKVSGLADEVVCLHRPAHFESVGQFYRSFPQIEDAEVVAGLTLPCVRRTGEEPPARAHPVCQARLSAAGNTGRPCD
jgi:putative phosphoribosyl transferase